ncbi:MAG TPA: class I SAM-dependent methyltransferase [Terriglobales bacterium]|nr:class I SAM-dependent methyltransferase [Terriglobales bacterium]
MLQLALTADSGSNAKTLEQVYANRFGPTEQYRFGVWKILIRKFFSKWIPKNATVLDLGCGWGEFINQIQATKKYAMDLNPETKKKLSSEVKLFSQDCSAKWPLADAELDVVFTSNFFEHLLNKESLEKTLIEAFRCLKPNGRLICLGPNIKHLSGAYWDFWDHYLPLTELSLQEELLLTGFQIDFIRAKFLPYSMSQGFTPPLLFLKLYLKFPFAWRIIGKQFCVIARKSGSKTSN